MQKPLRTLVWRNLDEPGLEYFSLHRQAKGWRLKGRIVMRLRGTPLEATYRVFADAAWKTRSVSVRLQSGKVRRSLELSVDVHQCWWRGKEELVPLRGCFDVDLSVTPSTNTLPIRRLKLKVGDQEDAKAAWVRFPRLSLKPLNQRYTRLTENRYSYDSRGETFRVELTVDDLGLVTDYPGLWRLEGTVE